MPSIGDTITPAQLRAMREATEQAKLLLALDARMQTEAHSMIQDIASLTVETAYQDRIEAERQRQAERKAQRRARVEQKLAAEREQQAKARKGRYEKATRKG